jgi:hypothetical protein
LLSGIWHGADWTFAIWGGLNGIYLIIENMLGIKKNTKSAWKSMLGLLYTYFLVNISWVFFRVNSLADLKIIFTKIVYIPQELAALLHNPLSYESFKTSFKSSLPVGKWDFLLGLFGIISIFLLSLYERKNRDICLTAAKLLPAVRWTGYFLLLFVTLCLGKFGDLASQFVYFRF